MSALCLSLTVKFLMIERFKGGLLDSDLMLKDFTRFVFVRIECLTAGLSLYAKIILKLTASLKS